MQASSYQQPIPVYWWNNKPNFGDGLAPSILEHFDIAFAYSDISDARLCLIGSILETIGPDYRGVIAGCGFLSDGPKHPFNNARVASLRGPLSKSRAAISKNILLGDPALIAHRLIEHPSKTYDVGLVPHYVDQDLSVVDELAKRPDLRVKKIDVRDAPLKVVSEIASCRFILSSSLHGLVVADAFEIPSVWWQLSNNVLGNGFKFSDYNASVGAETEAISIAADQSKLQLLNLNWRKPLLVADRQSDVLEALSSVKTKGITPNN